ncbi:hypothetical protein M8J75_002540 [Diaphorina citri]|nr:hypothetical protein M8J75_002540 [Diaphorina citri]
MCGHVFEAQRLPGLVGRGGGGKITLDGKVGHRGGKFDVVGDVIGDGTSKLLAGHGAATNATGKLTREKVKAGETV